ncbi:MAG: hypothetical protein ACD_15C00114G0001 [uncultured bacterium]|nr:MAG: hypothetical protein ACD_15C00114G0001 [uncultured bacterium]
MDNKKISTILGTVLIIIFAATALAFVLVYENKQSKSEINNNVAVISENLQPEENKKNETENKQSPEEVQKELQTLNSEDGNITYTAISKEDYHSMMIKNDKYSMGLMPTSKTQFIKYENKNLGISFIYRGNLKSYIKEVSPGKLQFIDYSYNKYSANPQDYIEIYSKKTSDTLEEAVKKLIVQKGADLKKCEINMLPDYMNGQAINVIYNKPFVYDKSKCLASDQGPICQTRQMDKYSKIASNNCSVFERSWFYNYFIYQSENTTNKIVFIRHVSGLDASSWDPSTIKLSN